MRTAVLTLTSLLILGAAGARTAAADTPPRTRVQLDAPVYRGSGCPAGSVQVSITPDNRTLSVLYGAFVVETRPGRQLAVKDCNLAIPIEVPAGYQLTVVRVDYRGFASVPRSTLGSFSARYWILGTSTRRSTTFPGGHDDGFLVSHELGQARPIRSKCGRRVELGVEQRVVARKRRASSPDEVFVQLDSGDLRSEVELRLEWTPCN